MYKFAVQRCFATPSDDINHESSYMFFEDKCKVDPTFMRYEGVDSNNVFSFSIKAFRFIAIKEVVVFHCEITVCKENSTGCDRACGASVDRKRRDVDDNGELEVIRIESGAIKHTRKAKCEETTCSKNAHCVDIFPATCRCNHGFVFDHQTKQCSSSNLFTVSGLHLDAQFRSEYADPGSMEFYRLATKVEWELMHSYEMDGTFIRGVKVVTATPGSIVLEVHVLHADDVTPREAFDSFVHAVVESDQSGDTLDVKRHVRPVFKNQQMVEGTGSSGVVVAVVVPLLVVVLLVVITALVCTRRRRGLGRSEGKAPTSYDNNGVILEMNYN